MGMDIQEKSGILLVTGHFLFQPEDLGLPFFARELPLPIDITPRHIRPIIATDDPINVDHRHHSKLKPVPQLFGLY